MAARTLQPAGPGRRSARPSTAIAAIPAGALATPTERLLALQRTLGNRAVGRLIGHRQPPAGPAGPPLQRKVGFEFESAWQIKGFGGILGSDNPIFGGTGWKVYPDMRAPSPADLKPESVVIEPGSLWDRRADVWYSGFGNVEFVTSAFEESEAGISEAVQAVREMQAFIEQVAGRPEVEVEAAAHGGGLRYYADEAATATTDSLVKKAVMAEARKAAEQLGRDPKASVDDIVGQLKPRAVKLLPTKGELTAAPQMTAGIKLSKLAELFGALGRGQASNLGGALLGEKKAQPDFWARKYGRSLGRARAAADQNLQVLLMDPDERQAYIGAVAQLVMIIRRARKSYQSEKLKYLTPLLSRTDFGKLPTFIRLNPDFKRDVLAAAKADPAHHLYRLDVRLFDYYQRAKGEDRSKFEAMLRAKKAPLPKNQPPTRLTVGEWLDAIVEAGRDRLDWGQDRKRPEWEPQAVGLGADRSLGHVFELRGIDEGLSYRDWDVFVTKYITLIRALNMGNEPPSPKRSHAPARPGVGLHV